MKIRFASLSLLLFLLSLTMVWLLTLFEFLLIGLSTFQERLISALLLLVPAIAGTVFGILSLQRKEPRPWIAIAGILLNASFAIFNILVLAFSG
ncbi:MAG: hypothetical protein ACM3XO_21325 [Bacteroidota bacterium]